MKQIFQVLKEQVEHFHLIRRLSLFEIKSKNANNFLGSSWEILNPLIQIMVYWFVFSNVRAQSGITLSNGTEIPYFYWLLSGFILWMFFQKAMIEGSNSIYTRLRIISKMSFPRSIVPSYVIFSHLYVHIVLVGIAIVLFNIGGFYVNIHYIELLYFIPATVFLVFSLSLITSTISVLVRDTHMLLNAVLRMFIYVSPVLWEIGKIGGILGDIVKLNPLYYLIEGYRAAFFGTEWYAIAHIEYTLYFWGVSILLFILGASIHNKFKRQLVDFL